MNEARPAGRTRGLDLLPRRWSASGRVGPALLSLALLAAAAGCEGEYEPEPRGGGYTEDPAPEPSDPAGNGGARSALGKAKESAERVINEDIAEYNRKLEEAADGKFE